MPVVMCVLDPVLSCCCYAMAIQQDKTGSNTHITAGMLLHQYIKFNN